MKSITHILLPTDLSDASEGALSMAVDLARSFDAQLTILHVWSMPYTSYSEGLVWPIDEMGAAARRSLSELFERVVARHPKTEAILKQGVEAQAILDVVAEHGIDLVVMGTHGRRGLPRVFLGSVAEKVVRLAPVPVLTVGPRAASGIPRETR